jgi:hypothetical protein
MVFLGEIAVGALDLVALRALADTEDVIEVALGHDQAPRSAAGRFENRPHP